MSRLAIIDRSGEYGYDGLAEAADGAARCLHERGPADAPDGARIAFHVKPGLEYASTLLGTWRAGGLAVPLCRTHPEPELDFVLRDTRPAIVVGDEERAPLLRRLAGARDAAFVPVGTWLPGTPRGGGRRAAGRASAALPGRASARSAAPLSPWPAAAGRDALILYTSGTTGRPKGVVLTHGNLAASVDALVGAWGWTADDRILHVLPLHHTHGIVNAFLCALKVGAAVDMRPGFDAEAVWEGFAAGRTTVFMAVPAIYVRLVRAWEAAPPGRRTRWSEGARRLRLMVSGSAALPSPLFERWREITGHALLERYGMTEIGMALSNPLAGKRRPGRVGTPLPGVDIRLLDEGGATVGDGTPGEIHVRGPAVFARYWERPDETAVAFRDGWFRTGDVAVVEDGVYRILGRRSVDIIETGGYKVSALEIENVLGGHPDVEECAVVGVSDPDWGEAVCAAILARHPLDAGALRDWARDRLAPYKVPRRIRCVPELPRNPMGKVTKPDVKERFFPSTDEPA